MSTKHGDRYQAIKFAELIIKSIGSEFIGNTESPTDIWFKKSRDNFIECKASKNSGVSLHNIAKAVFQLYKAGKVNNWIFATKTTVKKSDLINYFDGIDESATGWTEAYIKKYILEYPKHKVKIMKLIDDLEFVSETNNFEAFETGAKRENLRLLMEVKGLVRSDASGFLEKVYARYQGDKGPIDISDSILENYFAIPEDNLNLIDEDPSNTENAENYNSILFSIKDRVSPEFSQFSGIETDLDENTKKVIERIRGEYEKL